MYRAWADASTRTRVSADAADTHRHPPRRLFGADRRSEEKHEEYTGEEGQRHFSILSNNMLAPA